MAQKQSKTPRKADANHAEEAAARRVRSVKMIKPLRKMLTQIHRAGTQAPSTMPSVPIAVSTG